MKDYIVYFIGAKGNRNTRQFDTEAQAMKFYDKCNGEAIVKKYNPETFEYEVIKDVKYTTRKEGKENEVHNGSVRKRQSNKT